MEAPTNRLKPYESLPKDVRKIVDYLLEHGEVSRREFRKRFCRDACIESILKYIGSIERMPVYEEEGVIGIIDLRRDKRRGSQWQQQKTSTAFI